MTYVHKFGGIVPAGGADWICDVLLKHRAQEGKTAAQGGDSSPEGSRWEGRLLTSVGLFPQIHAWPLWEKHQENPNRGTFYQIPDHNSSKGSGTSRENGETVTWGPGRHEDKVQNGNLQSDPAPENRHEWKN